MHDVVLTIAATALIYTFVRTVLAGVLLGWLFSFRIPRTRRVLVSAALIAVFVVLTIRNTLTSNHGLDSSTMTHLAAIGDSFVYFAKQPWGYGISFSGGRPTQVPLADAGDLLELLLNVGPLGLFMFLRIYWKLLKTATPSSASPTVQACGSALQSSVVCLLVSMMQGVYFGSTSWIFHLWLGILAGVCIVPSTKVSLVHE
jgi:hypothetical protein